MEESSREEGLCDYTCSIYCIKSLDEAIRTFIFKCFGFQTNEHEPLISNCSQSSDVKETEDPPPPSSTTESAPSTDQPDTNISDDMALPFRFRPPPRPQPTRGKGPQTNSSGSC